MDELDKTINELERKYFFERTIGEASGRGYIASDTWRAWRSTPKIRNAPSTTLIAAFDFLTPRLDAFISQNPHFDRTNFDQFHHVEICSLYDFALSFNLSTRVHPEANGTFHGHAYNVYAKVVNLAHTHRCFRPDPVTRKPRYPPGSNPELLHSLHVPLDTRVNKALSNGYKLGNLPYPYFEIPSGGMGSIRTKQHYDRIQSYLRSIVDRIQSTNFPGNSVSPLAFEAYWQEQP